MKAQWGRFTARGGDVVEGTIRGALEEVGGVLETTLPLEEVRSVVLLGGYGRGEGGVETVGGEEKPHNNFDFLVITRPGASEAAIRERADRALAPLVERYGVGMDIGCISDSKLLRAPCLIIWHDMVHGHKTILGDREFVPSLSQFTVERILPFDVLRLLVNRGTLLVINDLILERPQLREAERRCLVRHATKAVIGYGDALLFFHGAYHWSYLEKQQRMRALAAAPPAFRDLYEGACEFRFRPLYEAYPGRNLPEWSRGVREALEPIHLECETRRLGAADLGWSRYPSLAFRRILLDGIRRRREWPRMGWHFISSDAAPKLEGLGARIGYRCAGGVGRLPIIFPLVAYGTRDPLLKGFAAQALSARGMGTGELRRAYLRAWGVHGDPNFPKLVRSLRLDLGGGFEG